MKSGEDESQTHSAPAVRSRSRLRGRADDADQRDALGQAQPVEASGPGSTRPRCAPAPCCPSAPHRSSAMPSTVSGLTNAEAPSAARVPSGNSRHPIASARRYCAYMPPPATATILPSSACAAGEEPAATTVPCALVAGRQRLAGPCRGGPHRPGRQRRGDHRPVRRARRRRPGSRPAPAMSRAEVGRVDRGRLDADDHLVRAPAPEPPPRPATARSSAPSVTIVRS